MKKLIVMSADALVWEDMEYLSSLPNFQKYLAGGAGIRQVRFVYPTITYPCHATMSTGVYPDKHGVTGNLEFHPGQAENLPGSGITNIISGKQIFLQRQRKPATARQLYSGR